MKLVWSQPYARQDRRRSVLLMAVVFLFLGGILSGRPEISEAPRPIRAAVASLLGTGGLLLLVGAAALVFPRNRRKPSLSLARPDPSDESEVLQEEEQR